VQFIGQSEVLDKTSFGGFDVRELSGLTHDKRARYYANADRVGGTDVSRFFTLDVPITKDSLGIPSVVDVTVLNKPDGTPSTGADFDGEGIAISKKDELYIASEGRAGFQTEVRRYALDGSLLETIPAPARFLVPPEPGGQGTNNLSFESMALSANGRSLFTANETPLTQDGVTADLEGRIRIVRYRNGGGSFEAGEQYYYLMDAARVAPAQGGALEVGVAEIVALSEEDLLVLERGFVAGVGNRVRIFRVSLEDAVDVSAEATLSAPGLNPLPKTLIVDLESCPAGGATLPPGPPAALQANPLLDNFEAMTLGPNLPGGRRALVLLSDDNSGANQRTRIVVLAVSRSRLVVED
jgi:hypothetical protein